MNVALRYLWVTARTNGLLAFLRGLKKPRKAIGTLIWIAVLALVVFGQWFAATQNALPSLVSMTSLSMFFAVLLAAGTIAGLLQHGLTFHASAVDFLFPGPFSRRQIAFYRIAALYPITMLSSVVFLVFLSARVSSLPRVALALFLLQVVALHLQTACAITSTALSDELLKRFRGLGQAVLGLLVSGAFLLVFFTDGSTAGGTGLGSRIVGLFDSGTAQIVFYPAFVAARLATATSWATTIPPLLGLLTCVVCSLVLAVSLPFDWLEASTSTSERAARILARARQGSVAGEMTGTARAKRLFGERHFFSGAGAIAWKNLVSLLRSARMIVAAALSAAIVMSFVIAFARGHQHDGDAGDGSILARIAPVVLLLPILVQQYVAFDFRRDVERLEELRQLPLRPIVVAFSEIVVPTLFVLVLQIAVGAVAIVVAKLPWVWLAFGAVTLPAFTATVITVANLGFLLHPVRAISASGRPNVGAASVSSILNMFGFVIVCLPALAVTYFVSMESGSKAAAVVAGLGVQCLVITGLLWLTGRAFARFDVSRSDV